MVDQEVIEFIPLYLMLQLYGMPRNITEDKNQGIELEDMETRMKVIHIVIVLLVLVKVDELAVRLIVLKYKSIIK